MDLLLQLIVNGIVLGSGASLVALGFGLIFNTTRVFHFAHGGVLTCAAYFTYMWSVQLHLPFLIAVVLAVPLTVMVGVLCEFLVYRQMRRWNAGHLQVFIASLGLLTFIGAAVTLAWGPTTRAYATEKLGTVYQIGSITITQLHAVSVILSILLTALVFIFLTRTRVGKSIRAVANNPDRAQLVGVNVDTTYLWTYAVGSGLAVIPAVIQGLDRGVNASSGVVGMLLAGIAVIVGGVGNTPGAVVGAYILAIATTVGVWKIPSEWQDTIAFVILIGVLLIRPRGLFGERVASAEV